MLSDCLKYVFSRNSLAWSIELSPRIKIIAVILIVVSAISLPLGCLGSGSDGSAETASSETKRLYEHGLELQRMKKWREALDVFLKTVAMQPKLAIAWLRLGRCYYELQDYDHAEKCLNYASNRLDLKGEDLRACLQWLIRCQVQKGELELVQVTRRSYVAKFPGAPDLKNISDEIKFYDQDFATTREQEALSARKNEILSRPTPLFRPWLGTARLPQMPIKVCISASKLLLPNKSYTKENAEHYKRLAKNAFLAWSTVVDDGRLRFEFVDNSKEAQILCEWTNNSKEKAHGFASGHCETIWNAGSMRSQQQRCLVFIGPTIVEKNNEFFEVCLHEIGHALGLIHSSNPKDVMYFAGTQSSLDKLAAPSPRDARNPSAIYSDPFRAAAVALEFGSRAFVERDYETAYQLLSEAEKKSKSPEQFEQALNDKQRDPIPDSIEIHQLYHDLHRDHINFMLLGKNQKNEKSYFSVQTVLMPDGAFKIAGASRDN
jgi:tetratricopeptide (TPR) repeat protein